MNYLSSILSAQAFYSELRDHVSRGSLPVVINGTASIHKSHIASTLAKDTGKPLLFIAADEQESARILSDIRNMGLRALPYPVRDFSFHPLEGMSHEFEHSRIEALCSLLSGECDAVVTVADAAMQLTTPPEQLKKLTVTFAAGTTVNMQDIVSSLTAGGYERAVCVEGPGQFSVRGGIIDFFPPAAPAPIRAELWGDEIDTLSYFDPLTQRRTDPADSITIYPASELTAMDTEALCQAICELAKGLRSKNAAAARERLYAEADSLRAGMRPASLDKYLPLLCEREATIFDYLPQDSLLCISEHTAVRERAKSAEARLNEEVKALIEDGVLCKGLSRFALTESELTDRFGSAIYMDTFAHGSFDTPIREIFSIDARQLPAWDGTVSLLIEDVQSLLAANIAVGVLAGSKRAADALYDDLGDAGIPVSRENEPLALLPGRVIVMEGALSYGMEYPAARCAVITYGRGASSSSRRVRCAKHKKGSDIQSLSELSSGDYVVHITHGIGMFGGIVKIATEGVTRDYIKITYAKGDVLYVPVTQLDLVSKYIGAKEDSGVKLSHLGGSDWNKHKSRVKKAVKDIAKELTKLYAERMKAEGWPFDPDTELQRDFEARFEYDETDDQLRCIREIKDDMERAVPMERLLCGDVGFGKTEVALRAAFKCLVEGRQCALLAPTTILAWQHWQTALRRFEGYGFRIELLSRFRTPKQQEEILRDLKKGKVHMIIGTHRIIQKDVQFNDLGLAIIDEEQRFGVAHKERFKENFHSVDILILSATPIPRTLNMALSGLRDISVLEEAPQDRLPVQTYVLEYDDAVIADAIRRELRRGGQVYYLHNRVSDIEQKAAKLREMVPDAVIGIAHGQMTEQQVSREWKRLIDHEIDILLCTTIIEAGVDVANANTLIIENAENFGLSQLHQIRGRVGRSSRRAYAYLTFNGRKELTEIASKRLSAIREFTEFGSGMKIAMRDLELRGAGNIHGGEQSGQLDMVGYDLYLKMLGDAVAEEKGEVPTGKALECSVDLPIEAHIPEHYIGETVLRLDIYRLIADIRTEEDASDVLDELIDRFGDPPEAVSGLIRVALMRNRAACLGITEIKQGGGNLLFFFADAPMERISAMIGALPGRVMLTPGAKTYLTVRPEKKLSVIDNVT
ncbi:MAG: transcription-repair coupling factor, partial [Clostridia bacterium]|nr:transcription-repair coupling factor [Clostridia bacterium]